MRPTCPVIGRVVNFFGSLLTKRGFVNLIVIDEGVLRAGTPGVETEGRPGAAGNPPLRAAHRRSPPNRARFQPLRNGAAASCSPFPACRHLAGQGECGARARRWRSESRPLPPRLGAAGRRARVCGDVRHCGPRRRYRHEAGGDQQSAVGAVGLPVRGGHARRRSAAAHRASMASAAATCPHSSSGPRRRRTDAAASASAPRRRAAQSLPRACAPFRSTCLLRSRSLEQERKPLCLRTLK